MFDHVPAYAGDPILTLNEQFHADPRPVKLNLGIGVYLDADGRLPTMRAVCLAEQSLYGRLGPRPYLPMEGAASFFRASRDLVFGRDHPAVIAGNIASIQSLGGSGALRLGADFIRRHYPHARVWLSDPTWDNHHGIFAGAGLECRSYPYYDPDTARVDFAAMMQCIHSLAPGDVVLLHACCHNPTGADLQPWQWHELASVMAKRGLLAFFDMAYQGFGKDLDADAYAIRDFAQQGVALLVASSFSKNFSFYGERCGALHVACADAIQADNVLGQLKAAVRRLYSSPPTHGARVIATILESEELRAQWCAELADMRQRVQAMRSGLHAVLAPRVAPGRVDYLRRQSGMFSFTGLTPAQVATLRDEHGVYLVGSGRLCLAALTMPDIDMAASAIASVMADG